MLSPSQLPSVPQQLRFTVSVCTPMANGERAEVGEGAVRVGERLPWCRCSADALLLFEFRDERKLCRRIPGMRAVGERAYFTPVKETLGAGLRAAGKVQAVQPDPAILRRPGRAGPNRTGAGPASPPSSRGAGRRRRLRPGQRVRTEPSRGRPPRSPSRGRWSDTRGKGGGEARSAGAVRQLLRRGWLERALAGGLLGLGLKKAV